MTAEPPAMDLPGWVEDLTATRLEITADGIAWVVLDRERQANARNQAMREELERLYDHLARSPAVKVVVLTGAGDRFFSAGMDLKAVPAMGSGEQRRTVDGINRLFAGWYAFPRPVVAAVNGHAIAGGLILALCADRRVGGTEGSLGLSELAAGIPYPFAAISIVRAELTPPAARRLVLGADLVTPEQALALGALDELAADPLPRAIEIASELAQLPHKTYGHVKRQLRGPVIEAMERGLSGGAGDPALDFWVSDETRAAAERLLGGGPGSR